MSHRSLVIGYGNVYCHDDGVGFFLVNLLRNRFGQEALPPDEDGLDRLGQTVDTAVLHQLVPEIIPILVQYQTVFFVDAHTGSIPDEIRISEVKEEIGFHAVTHHMSPGMLLAMARQTHHRAPAGYLVSVRGDDFDFGLGLSEPCRRRAETVPTVILDLIGDREKMHE
jgi:hydrogenase maturation protease